MVFKIRFLYYILDILFLLFCKVCNDYQFGDSLISKILTVFLFALFGFIIVEALFTKYTIDDKGVASYYWLKKTSVEWQEITAVEKQNGILFNGGTNIITKNKSLYIKESVTNYHKLLRIILEQIPDPSKVRFDGLNDLKDFVALTNRKIEQDQ